MIFDSPTLSLSLDEANILWRCGGWRTNTNITYSVKLPVGNTLWHHLWWRTPMKEYSKMGWRRYWSQTKVLDCQREKHISYPSTFAVQEVQGKTSPLPPPLFIYCVKQEPSFSCTAVNFARPLYVNIFGMIESRKICCVTYMVHLDVMSAPFIRALKRFCARSSTQVSLWQWKDFQSSSKDN